MQQELAADLRLLVVVPRAALFRLRLLLLVLLAASVSCGDAEEVHDPATLLVVLRSSKGQ